MTIRPQLGLDRAGDRTDGDDGEFSPTSVMRPVTLVGVNRPPCWGGCLGGPPKMGRVRPDWGCHGGLASPELTRFG